MREGIFRQLLRRPFGLWAFLVLVLLYACAIFAPFLAPYRVSDQSLEHSFHPPSRLIWQAGALHAQLYENVDPSAARWEPIPGETVPVRLFAPGYRYDVLFGLTSWDRHLLVPDPSRPDARVYLLGSDATGRDVFSRLLYGARVSLSIGLIGISIRLGARDAIPASSAGAMSAARSIRRAGTPMEAASARKSMAGSTRSSNFRIASSSMSVAGWR